MEGYPITKKLHILVTGGAGFIGSHLVDRLLQEGHFVRVLDNYFSSDTQNLAHIPKHESFQFIQGDIRDLALLNTLLTDIEVVFHEAAQRNVAFSIRDPLLTHDINVTGTLNLLQASVKAGVKRFIFASTAAVYGHPKHGIKEDALLLPTSPYGVSKVATEQYARLYQELYDLPTVGLRYFNVYGPRQQTGGAINTFLSQVMENQSPTIYGDGNQIRDFVHVHDVVEANLLALTSAATGIFNIASDHGVTINDLAQLIIQLSGKSLTPCYLPPRSNDPLDGSSDITKARQRLGYQPQITLTEGITALWQYRQEKPNGRES